MIRNDEGNAALFLEMRYETILLIEADWVTGRMLGNALRLYGYFVLLACDGDEAISICKRHLGRIDLAVLDVATPQIGGFEIAHHLTATRPSLKVLYVSDGSDNQLTERCTDASAVLRKPFTPTELAARIRQAFQPEPCLA